MPVPSAVISVPICSDDSILSMRARSTFKILPRNGSTAWNSRLRPCLALPPALSPSTMNSSDLAGSRSWQSASLPGSDATPSTLLRVISRLARRLPGRRGLDDLADDDLALGEVFLEPCRQRLVEDAFHHRAHLGGY